MTDDLSPSAREALDVLRAERGACPDAEQLVAYEALSSDARWTSPLHAHVQVCSRCQLVLHYLKEPAADRPRVWSFRLMIPVAAALLLAIVVAPRVFDDRFASPPPAPEATIRGSDIQPVAPIGSVRDVREFHWQSPIVASRYRLTVSRNGERLWSAETSSSTVKPPADLRLDPGVEYQWKVEALDRGGYVLMASPTQSFSIR